MMETMRKLVVPVAVLLVLAAVLSASVFADEWPWSAALGRRGPEEGGPGGRVASVEATTVRVSPSIKTATEGQLFDVAVAVVGAENLAGYWFEMSYDPAVIEVLGVEDGGFIEANSDRVMFREQPPDVLTGTVTYGYWTVPPGDELVPGADGSGTLAVIHLEAKGLGTSGLDFEQVKLYITGEDLPQAPDTTEDGTVEVVACEGASITAVEMTPDPAEVGEQVQFDADVSGTAPIVYTWDFGDGSDPESAVGMDMATHTYDATGTYTATLTVENDCGDDEEQFAVTVEQACDLEILSLTVTPEQADVGEEVAFEAEVVGTTPITYTWDFGDGTAPESGVGMDTATHTYTSDGSFTVTLTVENFCGIEEEQGSVSVGESKVFLPLVLKAP